MAWLIQLVNYYESATMVHGLLPQLEVRSMKYVWLVWNRYLLGVFKTITIAHGKIAHVEFLGEQDTCSRAARLEIDNRLKYLVGT